MDEEPSIPDINDGDPIAPADRQIVQTLLRVAVPLCAIVGAFAIGFAAFLTNGMPSVLCGIAWIAAIVGAVTWPRDVILGGRIVFATGSAGMLLFGSAMLMTTAPWELVAFWGSSALMLAYLTAYVGASSSDQRRVATIIAVVSLLVLTAMGLGQYVFVAFSPPHSPASGFAITLGALGVAVPPRAPTTAPRRRSIASQLRRRGR
ncbi:MAG: hypothetical protein AB2L09_07110 [Coriobacteriia bacterium]